MRVIPHSRPTLGKQELTALSRVVRSGYLSAGKEVAALEKEMRGLFKVKDVAAVATGTAALHLALAGLKIGPGDEVILPTYVCTAVLNAVHYVGAAPVLADVGSDDGNIDPQDAARRVTPRTRAIIVPHMFGFPADIKALLKTGVPLIEDCAQSAGAKIGARPVGSFGRAAVSSFYATKMMACGEGGVLMSGDAGLMAEARELLSYDHRGEYRLRFNYKLTDLQASVARAQAGRLAAFIAARRKVAAEYTRRLEHSGLVLPSERKGTQPVFYRYVIRVKDPVSFMAAMKKRGINAERPLFRPLHYYLGLTGYPAADRLQKESVSLPVYPSLTRAEIDHIVKSVLAVNNNERIQ
jgi:dTDP-4-amino-4,6-dideoxygalactose transaminase